MFLGRIGKRPRHAGRSQHARMMMMIIIVMMMMMMMIPTLSRRREQRRQNREFVVTNATGEGGPAARTDDVTISLIVGALRCHFDGEFRTVFSGTFLAEDGAVAVVVVVIAVDLLSKRRRRCLSCHGRYDGGRGLVGMSGGVGFRCG